MCCMLQTVEDSLSTAMTMSTPEDQVTALIKQVAAENDLQVEDQLRDIEPGQSSLRSEASAAPIRKEDQLEQR